MNWAVVCAAACLGFLAGYLVASWYIERTVEKHLARFNRRGAR